MLRPAIAVGGLMTVVGAFVVYGAVTGNLAAMLAAIFDPGVLGPSTSSQSAPLGSKGVTPETVGGTASLGVTSWLQKTFGS